MKRTILVALTLLFSSALARAEMKVHFINVGQAESMLLEFETAAVLIDAGGESTGDDRDRDHLLSYLNDFFDRRTDLRERTGRKRGVIYSLIVSHPHIDHTRFLRNVMENFKVLNLVDGGGTKGSGFPQLRGARRLAREQGAIYNRIDDEDIDRRGYQTSWLRALSGSGSDADLRFLGGGRGCENENNNSLVLLVRHRGAEFLFVGDAESEMDDGCGPGQIESVLDFFGDGDLLDVDLYKVGHHGSHNGTTRALLEEMTPEVAVISAGHHSTREPGPFHAFQFGHPRQSVVDELEELVSGSRPRKTVYAMDKSGRRGGRPVDREMRKAVYCTCWDGDVVVSVGADGRLSVEPSQ
jgi:competence protein ComEC